MAPRRSENRKSSTGRGYDADWYRVRNRFIATFRYCQHPGCNQPAEHVDHIKPVARHPELRLSWSNLRALCAKHHNSRTASEMKAETQLVAGNRADGMPIDPRHPWYNGGRFDKAVPRLSRKGLAFDSVRNRFVPL